MNRKLKLVLAALLGFSAACSSVKNAPEKGREGLQTEADSVSSSLRHRIIVMYGVRPPESRRDKVQQAEQLDSVVERSRTDSLSAGVSQRVSEAENPIGE